MSTDISRRFTSFTDDHLGYLEAYTTVKLSDLTKNVSRFVSAARHAAEVSNNYYVIYGLTSVFTAFLLDRLIDTDKNVSNTQTAATVALSSAISQAIAQAASSQSSRLSPIKDMDVASICYDNINIMQGAVDRLDYIQKLPEFARTKKLQEVGISESEFLGLMQSMNTVLSEAHARYNFIMIVLAVIAASNAVHGYSRNDKASTGARIGFSLLWALSGASGLGLSLSQGYCKPLSKVSTVS